MKYIADADSISRCEFWFEILADLEVRLTFIDRINSRQRHDAKLAEVFEQIESRVESNDVK